MGKNKNDQNNKFLCPNQFQIKKRQIGLETSVNHKGGIKEPFNMCSASCFLAEKMYNSGEKKGQIIFSDKQKKFKIIFY